MLCLAAAGALALVVAAASAVEQPGPEERELPRRSHRGEAVPGHLRSPDEALQPVVPEPAIPAPSLTFEGLSNAENFTIHGWRVAPPDATGDVGPNHYVQVVNSLYRVFSKSGAALTPARKLSSIFTPLGGPCLGRDDGHPTVLYDGLADRWLISQACLVASPNTHQLVAVSQTGDPTGAWFLYDFVMPNAKLQDEAKFGVWRDAYYMAANQYSGATFAGTGVFAFDRARMLAGAALASQDYVYRDLAALDPDLGGMLPADVDGLRAPPAGAPGLFAAFAATEFGDPADAIRLFEFTVDFANPAASTFTERAGSPLLVAPFDPSSPPGLDDIEQPAPALADESLDSVSDRLMYRLAYRRSAGHESLAVTHTVNLTGGITLATYQAGVRHYELRRTAPDAAFSVHEQASGLNDGTNRWLGSAALDHQGNLAVAYSASSASVAPSLRYAGRLATDPSGGLMQGEAILRAGTFVQRSTGSRWGMYGGLSVDPADDCTFWMTGEYYAADDPLTLVEWQTRIGRFKFATCTAVPTGTLAGVVRNALSGAAISGALVRVDAHSRTTSAAGGYSFTLPAGAYEVDVTRACYLPASASVTVATGATTTRDFALTPTSVIAVTAPVSVTVASVGHSASVPNNAGSTYAWTIRDRAGADLTALITAGQGTSQITFNAGSPGTTLFLAVTETPSGPACPSTGARRVQVDFNDVPPAHPFHDYVINIAGNGITAGCAPGDYCPSTPTLRAQIAVFLLRAREGVAYVPPPATGVFSDVPASDFFAPWIEELYRRQVTQGCNLTPPMYCPGAAITRAQMAPFLLKTREGSGYVPPPAVGVFDDVPVTHVFADWIEEIARRGITTGCNLTPPLYCPGDPTTRGQMAVFLVRTFGLVFP